MNIPIKINDKKYNIKPIAELSTKEFIELSKIENCDLVKYIAWQTKVKLDEAFFAVTSKTVELAVGKTPDITKMKCMQVDYIDYKKTIETVGQRHQVENSNLQGFDLIVFTLAVSQAQSNNIDDVNKLRDEYFKKPFLEILPAGFFFFKNYKSGRKKGRSDYVI